MVLRGYVRAEILANSPDIAAVEGRELQLAESLPAPRPRLLARDASTVCQHETPLHVHGLERMKR